MPHSLLALFIAGLFTAPATRATCAPEQTANGPTRSRMTADSPRGRSGAR